MCWEKWETRQFFQEHEREQDEEKRPVTFAEEKADEPTEEREAERELTPV